MPCNWAGRAISSVYDRPPHPERTQSKWPRFSSLRLNKALLGPCSLAPSSPDAQQGAFPALFTRYLRPRRPTRRFWGLIHQLPRPLTLNKVLLGPCSPATSAPGAQQGGFLTLLLESGCEVKKSPTVAAPGGTRNGQAFETFAAFATFAEIAVIPTLPNPPAALALLAALPALAALHLRHLRHFLRFHASETRRILGACLCCIR